MMTTKTNTHDEDGYRRPKLVRFKGRIVSLDEISGADIAANLPAARASELKGLLAGNNVHALRPKASGSRIQQVVHALADDPACKGKDGFALELLANDDCLTLSGSALIKLIAAAGKPDADGQLSATDDMRMVLAELKARNSNHQSASNGGQIQ